MRDNRKCTRRWPDIPEDEQRAIVDDCREYKAKNPKVSWEALGRRYGLVPQTLRRRVDLEFYEYDRQRQRQRINSVSGFAHLVEPRILSDAEIAARKAQIPEDTRDLTARLFGDPLPGRSALDQMERA